MQDFNPLQREAEDLIERNMQLIFRYFNPLQREAEDTDREPVPFNIDISIHFSAKLKTVFVIYI
ncbi:MAG: hypothetical protein Q3Y17_10770, partial [Blautia sp.]|nr:hypothetical protein [Blautia sp.]